MGWNSRKIKWIKKKQVSSSILTPSNWQMKFTNDKGPFVILRTFIISIMVGSCAAYGCKTENRWLGTFHFSISHITLLNFCKNGYKQYEEKICFQASIVWYVVHTSQNLVFVVRPGKRGRLLKEKAVQTEFPAFASHLQKCTITENLNDIPKEAYIFLC